MFLWLPSLELDTMDRVQILDETVSFSLSHICPWEWHACIYPPHKLQQIGFFRLGKITKNYFLKSILALGSPSEKDVLLSRCQNPIYSREQLESGSSSSLREQ